MTETDFLGNSTIHFAYAYNFCYVSRESRFHCCDGFKLEQFRLPSLIMDTFEQNFYMVPTVHLLKERFIRQSSIKFGIKFLLCYII